MKFSYYHKYWGIDDSAFSNSVFTSGDYSGVATSYVSGSTSSLRIETIKFLLNICTVYSGYSKDRLLPDAYGFSNNLATMHEWLPGLAYPIQMK